MNGLRLTAIDGANPLGFLAALGTLRLSALLWHTREIALAWERSGHWVPVLSGLPELEPTEFCQQLLLAPPAPVEAFEVLGKNLTVAPSSFVQFVDAMLAVASPSDRRGVDFAAAFGSEVCKHETLDRIQYSSFSFITGSGHQDFLTTIGRLKEVVSEDHLFEALFDRWRNRDEKFSFRWDPLDAREYSLRWTNPSKEGSLTTWGANRLAFEALPFFPACPESSTLKTTGFRRGRPPEFSWPIWRPQLTCDEVTSLVALSAIHEAEPDAQMLRRMGIEQVYRAAQVRIGQGANFKVSFRPARAV